MGWGAHALCCRDLGGALRRPCEPLGGSRRRARTGAAPCLRPGRRPAGAPRRRGDHGGPAAGGLGGPATHHHRPRCRHLPPRLLHRRPDPRVAVPDDPRRARPHHPADLLREAAAAPGRHRLPRTSAACALTRGGSDGPGAAVTTRGEITRRGQRVEQNLSEEPGGGVFSMRRATIRQVAHQRQPGQRRRRRGVRPPRRRPGLRLGAEQQPRRRFGRRDRLHRRHPRGPVARRRQHHRRRRRRALRRRGRRRHGRSTRSSTAATRTVRAARSSPSTATSRSSARP